MDRDTFYKKFKDNCVGTRSYIKTTSNNHTRSDSSNILRSNHHNSMLKSPWTQVHREDSIISGLSWPPRSYTCSFCKREFRSAQALGGHMNVHRRDRARLRHSSPTPDHDTHFLSLNPNPNLNPYASPSQALNNPYPNPNLNPKDNLSSHGMKYPLFPSPHLLHSSPLASSSSSSTAIDKHPMEVYKLGSAMNQQPKGASLTKAIIAKSFLRAEEFDYCKKGEGSRLRMESDYVCLDLEIGVAGDRKENLDLELRLGTS